MPDREKVIKGLEYCAEKKNCGGCPYFNFSAMCQDDLNMDALAMLKEHEKATVISIHRNGFGSRVGACPNCQIVLHYEYNQSFCGKCGQAVKWNA